MIEVDKIIGVLDSKKELLERLKDQKLGGFALIFPPGSPHMEIILMGSEVDDPSFYKMIVDQWSEALNQSQYGGTTRKVF